MPLSRLENFLKNAEGNILYVNPSDFDATDSFENRGNSLTRPFRTIQRALIEAARFSYQVGRNNDKIDTTTVLVYPGTHYIDNRPGFSIQDNGGSAEFRRNVNGSWVTSGATIDEFTELSNFDIFDEDNDLYKFNSTEGGVILPRGTSIVGLDLRKTKIRPMYVPDPENSVIPNSAIFRVTGTCYFSAFSFFDADPNRSAYKDQSGLKVAPTFSHHKLTCFEYADGVNEVVLNGNAYGLTDLEMYYYKVTHAYGDSSGRGLANYPVAAGIDFEPSIDEYRIVGDLRADSIGVTSIRAGDGVIPSQTITVITDTNHGLYKDTPVLVSGITTDIQSYNGSFFVTDVLDDTTFTYTATTTPVDPLPSFAQFINSNIIVESDSTSSASPYVFSCTLRSVYGLNGLHADGSKATGFKSMLTAQFTGISLQKDDNAFILYDEETGIYNDNLTVSENQKPLHTNSRAIYKPGYENVHMKCSNDSIIQCVSIFAIGYAKHFVAESGGDQSITNSNSNFGAIALESAGFRSESFDRDDVGYITHIIPPREPDPRESAVSWLPLDATKIVSAANTERLYIADYKSADILPPAQVDSYRIGAKIGEELILTVIVGSQQNEFRSPVLMQVPSGIGTSSQKVYSVGRNTGINSISSNIITLTEDHQLFNGEKVRVYSDNGKMPSSIENNKVYYALTSGLNSNQLKLSSSLNDANSGNNVTGISNKGGSLTIISSVSDKNPGDAGHPIQYDTTENQWYILSSKATFFNQIYDGIVGIGTSILGEVTGGTYVERKLDNRGIEDKLYKARYVIPKEFTNARAPSDGFILQESKNVGVGSASFLSSGVADPTQLRNPKIIVNATYLSGTATIQTELPHNLVPGDKVKITNIVSTNNTSGNASVPFNGSFEVFTTPNPKEFTYVGLTSDPGTFLNETNQRSTQSQVESLPVVQREKYRDSLFLYRTLPIKEHIPGTDGQDGIYLLTLLSGSVKPESNVGFGLSEKKFNQDIRNLYPQQDRDNFNSDPQSSITHARLTPLGSVNQNDKRKSVTKEAIDIFFDNNRIGYAVTGVTISGAGNTTLTLYTNTDHNLNAITGLSLINPGAGYNNAAGVTSTLYSANLVNNNITGKLASVKASISVGNTITDIQIVDGGCAYGIGNTMTISADPAGTPSVDAVVQVTSITDNIGDTLELSGFVDSLYNGIFKILDIPSSRQIKIYNPNGIGPSYTERNDERYPIVSLVSKGVDVSNINFTKEVGIATLTCNTPHGLLPGNTFKIVGLGNTYFSRKQIVSEVVGLNTITFNAGVTTITQSFSYTDASLHKYGYSANGKALGSGEENIGGRGSYLYAGFTTSIGSQVTKTDTSITLTATNGIKKGDYYALGSEIIRISADPVGLSVDVNRGQFSTASVAAVSGTLIKKVRVLPMEIRRHSILRASGHTFEYLGFGPGNYSTGLPLKQDRVLSNDEVLTSQAREQDGGTVVYTGMNDRGEFFSGATKIKGTTGEEEVIEAPIVSYYGDDANTEAQQRNSGVFDDLVVKERITVEGGENNNQTSQFYGPVNFSQKVTNTSEEGLETRDLYIKGVANQAKLITVGISTPAEGKRSGDMILLANPDPGYTTIAGISGGIVPGGYIGHIYADGDWRRFGFISRDKNASSLTLDYLGIGQSTGVYDWSNELTVNGQAVIKDLYVGGTVQFAANQSFAGVTYDTIEVNDAITFNGTQDTDNYSILHTNANLIAQFQRMEVTGTAATFSSNTEVTFANDFVSTYAGVSTIQGTLDVGNLVCAAGILTATEFKGDEIGVQTITVYKDALITSGIITAARIKYLGGFGNAGSGQTEFSIYANSGFVTSITGTYSTITNMSATNALISKGTFNNYLTVGAAGVAHIPTGITTTLSGTNLTYSRSNVGLSTVTNQVITDWIGAPTAYVNTGIVTGLIAKYVGGGHPGSVPLVLCANVGVVTSLTGTAVTFAQGRITGNLAVNATSSAPTGVFTVFTGRDTNITGVATASFFESKISGSSNGSGNPPFVVASSKKVTNLNADLLDGYTTATSATNSTIAVRTSNGSLNCANLDASGTISGTLEYSVGVSGNLTGSAYDNSASRTFGLNETSNLKTSGQGNYLLKGSSGNITVATITADSFSTGNFSGGSISGTTANFSTSLNVNTGNTGGGTKMTLQYGGDFVLYSAGNTNSVAVYCDNASEFKVAGSIYATNDITAFSDMRLKKDVEKITSALDKINKLSGFTYEFNEKGVELGHEEGKRHTGVSAQELQEVLPEAVKDDNEYLMVKYDRLVPLLIEAVKELSGEVTELRAELNKLKGTK